MGLEALSRGLQTASSMLEFWKTFFEGIFSSSVLGFFLCTTGRISLIWQPCLDFKFLSLHFFILELILHLLQTFLFFIAFLRTSSFPSYSYLLQITTVFRL
uniref:Uncharacterized protein n=1 Tax=Cacopsylla melanoneura TaxID=428564 RepID=A0A8D8W458_9HEMI